MYGLNPVIGSDRSNRDLLSVERPREKLQAFGLAGLTEEELLSLIIGRGSRGTPVEAIASELNELIFSADGSTRIPTLAECEEIKGLGRAKATAVLAGLELGRRSTSLRGRPIHSPEDALVHLCWMATLRREHFQVLYLDTRRRLLRSETISIGTLNASLVHPREVFRTAFLESAQGLLVAHNHPSGDPEPSTEDLALTRRLAKIADLLGFTLVDHLIVAGNSWVSIRQLEAEKGWDSELFAA